MKTRLILPLILTSAALALAGCRNTEASFRDSGTAADDAGATSEDAAAMTGDDAQPTTGGDAAVTGRDALPTTDVGAIDDDAGTTGGRDAQPAPDAVVAPTSEPQAGDLVFVEIQGNPQGVADDQAEYVELLNVSGRDLDLIGCHLTHRQWAGTGMAPEMSVGNHAINTSVPVAAGGRVLLVRSRGGYFGGARRDYVYSGFEISNGGDDNNRFRLMSPRWDGREPTAPSDIIDELVAPRGTFDNVLRGRAWQLDPARVATPTAATNDDPASWCHASSAGPLAYWMDNWGTPGAANACN